MEYICKFCGKQFKTEKGFQKHHCEKMDRWNNFNWFGFLAFNMFSKSNHIKIYDSEEEQKLNFIKSKYYKEFDKFGKWLLEMNVIDVPSYIKYLIKFVIPIHQWCSEKILRCFLYDYLRTEPISCAIVRSEKYLQEHNVSLDNISSGRLYIALKNGFISNRYLQTKNFDYRNLLKNCLSENEFNQLEWFLSHDL